MYSLKLFKSTKFVQGELSTFISDNLCLEFLRVCLLEVFSEGTSVKIGFVAPFYEAFELNPSFLKKPVSPCITWEYENTSFTSL